MSTALVDEVLHGAAIEIAPDDWDLIMERAPELDSAQHEMPGQIYDLEGVRLEDVPDPLRELCWRDGPRWVCAAHYPEGVVVHLRRDPS